MKRRSTIELEALRAQPEDKMRALLARGMSCMELCLALGVSGRALDRFLLERPDMRKAWADGRIAALWGE